MSKAMRFLMIMKTPHVEMNCIHFFVWAVNMIVAASNDGILVSDKETSGYMKPYVEKLGNMAMFAENHGYFTVLDVQLNSMTVNIYLKENHSMKYHSHEQRSEIWTIVSRKRRCCCGRRES